MARVLRRPTPDKLVQRTALSPTPDGSGRGPDGRFLPSNQAARRHGLRASSRQELRRTHRRAGRLTSRLVVAFADAGRPLEPLSLPTARKWAELEVLRVDLFAALQSERANDKHHDRYLATTRLQLVVEKELHMTPSLLQQLRTHEADPVLEIQRLKAVNHE